ncbi:tyrosine-type recombinase/integrase, partial [Candidatus Riflebacteria bacterium]
EHIESKRVKCWVYFMRYCGLRKEEACSIKHKWIDRKSKMLTVGDEKFRPKNGEDREIPIPDELMDYYSSVFKKGKQNDYLFPGKDSKNKPMSGHDGCVKNAKNKAGLTSKKERWTTHCLRKSFCQQHMMNGVDFATIQDMADHYDFLITLRHYLKGMNHKSVQKEFIENPLI